MILSRYIHISHLYIGQLRVKGAAQGPHSASLVELEFELTTFWSIVQYKHCATVSLLQKKNVKQYNHLIVLAQLEGHCGFFCLQKIHVHSCTHTLSHEYILVIKRSLSWQVFLCCVRNILSIRTLFKTYMYWACACWLKKNTTKLNRKQVVNSAVGGLQLVSWACKQFCHY